MNLFYGKSNGGFLVWSNVKAIMEYLRSVDGKNLVIRIDRETGKRSMPQNDWYWGVVLKTVAEHTGSTEQELHEVFKRMFLPPTFIKYRDSQIKVPGSTTALNKTQFAEYIERIRAEVATMGVIIPEPKKDTPITVDDLHKDLDVPDGDVMF